MSQELLSNKTQILNEMVINEINDDTQFIIIDGFDGEGKTTFAKQLSDRLSMKYIHYPLFNKSYDTTWGYLEEMLSTVDILNNSVVDRHVFSTIGYNNIKGHEWAIESLLDFIKNNGLVIMGKTFYELIKYKLMFNRTLYNKLEKLNMIIINPYIMRKPDFEETIKHMSDKDSINWIRTQIDD